MYLLHFVSLRKKKTHWGKGTAKSTTWQHNKVNLTCEMGGMANLAVMAAVSIRPSASFSKDESCSNDDGRLYLAAILSILVPAAVTGEMYVTRR